MKAIIDQWRENPVITTIIGAVAAALLSGVGMWCQFVTSTLSEIKVELANRPDRIEIMSIIENEAPYTRERPVLQLELKHIRDGQLATQVAIDDIRRTLSEVRDTVIRNGGKAEGEK